MESYEITEEQIKTLSPEDQEKYKKAIEYKNHEWACGTWGGWVRGNELLIELGWSEKNRRDGHRKFVSLEKPERFR